MVAELLDLVINPAVLFRFRKSQFNIRFVKVLKMKALVDQGILLRIPTTALFIIRWIGLHMLLELLFSDSPLESVLVPHLLVPQVLVGFTSLSILNQELVMAEGWV